MNGERDLLDKILNEPKKLSDSQKDAVLSKKSHLRIIAGAGAGKTETLTRKIVYLLLHEKVDPSSIVAFTFTEKAAQSMKSRVYDRIKHMAGDEICAKLGDMFVGTIHGYCSQLLEDYFGYGDYGVIDENQEMAFLMRVGWEIGLGKSGKYSTNCETFLNTSNVVYGELILKSKIKKDAPEFQNHFLKYEEILDSHKRLTFNRMINLTIENLSPNPEVLEHVKYLIVDEYQDINRAQEKLIRLIGEKASIFIVGDPRQTIYQWRGSDEGCFDDFVTYYSDTDTVPITENRRSTKSILNIANEFADKFETKYAHLDSTRKEDGAVYLGQFEDAAEEAEWIADQIESHVNSGACTYSDFGILFRSVKTSAPAFIDIFRERNIPVMVGGKVGLFRRYEIKAVGKLFAWLFEGAFWKDNSDEEPLEGDDILYSALEDWNIGASDISLPGDMVSTLVEWKKSALAGEYGDFSRIYHELLIKLGFHQLEPDNPNHMVIMANLGRFGSILSDYEAANMLGGRKRKWERDLKGLFWYMTLYATSSYEEQAGDDIGGVDAVQLMTVHQAKGLEWPIVFIPSMLARRFPSTMTGRQRKWSIPRDMFDVEKYEGDIDSERKLFYVALTRAKEILVVSYFKRVNNNVKPSEFITDDLDVNKMIELSSSDTLPLCKVEKIEDIEDLQTFAASELITYGKCPYLYRFTHVWNYQPGLDPMLGYGNTLHFCLRRAGELIRDEGYNSMSAIVEALDENFHLPFAGKTMTENAKRTAVDKLVRFVTEHEDDMNHIKEVESRIEFPMQKATVMGKVDVILHDDEGLEIRDYKTSDSVTSMEEVALQVQLYTKGLKMIGEPVTKGSVSFLENASTESVDVSEMALQNAETNAERYIDGIMKRDFTACPGTFCGKCNFKRICKFK
ncbi:ATP-dependent DNA helicase [Methanococcoides sp. AM1]|uniref:ATP-dependent helicase n=1 Tax=Methanococcoides sp. AM1 TaxID=1201011 RepID=UPI001082BDC1|nr:ATP-dependent DNA helicase [Methanococcoides sp. AM1]